MYLLQTRPLMNPVFFQNIKELPLCSGVCILIGLQPLSLSPPYFPLFCSTLAPSIAFLCDRSPPLRLSSFLSILHLVIPYSFQSQRPTLHPKLSLLISVLSPHINIPQPLLLPVNRVTLQSAVTPLPPDSMPSLSLPHSCG